MDELESSIPPEVKHTWMSRKSQNQGSHGHGKSRKKLSWKVIEKSWNMKTSQKVMEKSWNCFFSWLWQLSSLWLSCMLWDINITISETMWEWESWKKANQSWKSHGILFSDFCGNPENSTKLFSILCGLILSGWLWVVRLMQGLDQGIDNV